MGNNSHKAWEIIYYSIIKVLFILKMNQSMNNKDQQAAIELAVFNLGSVTHLNDHQMMANQIQSYLQICGNSSLQQVQGSANVPMVANIFALTGSVLDLMLYATQPFKDDAGIQQAAMLAANLIGLFLSPQNEAHARIALRPMFGLMAECLYKKDGKLRDSDLKRLELHLNDHIAGDLGEFLLDTKGKLGGLLASASSLGSTILTTIATSGAGVSLGVAAGGASADTRDPKEQFNNWVSPLLDLISVPSQADLRPKIDVKGNSHLQVSASLALATLGGVIAQQSSGQKYTLSWLLDQTLNAFKDFKKQGNASVPINQTGEYERHTKGDTLEFVTLQTNALNNPPCAHGTGQDISYALGTERVNHRDFFLPQLGFSFNRLYSSQLTELDSSTIGARWMTPFSHLIFAQENGFILLDDKGRKIRLPSSILTQPYDVPYEDIHTDILDNGNVTVSFGGDWQFEFQRFHEELIYHLVLEQNLKTKESVVLNYLLHGEHAVLKSVKFKFKRANQTLKFGYNQQVKIIAIFVDEQAEPLASYDYDAHGNLIQATDQNGQHRRYEYNDHHQLTRYTDRTGRGQNVRYDSTLADAKAIEEWADDGSFHT